MRRDSEHVVRCVLADMTASVLAMAAAYWIRFRVMADGTPTEGPGALLLWAGAFSPAFPALYALLGVYSPGEGPDAPRRLGAMWLGATLGVMLYIDVIYLFHRTDFSRRMLWIDWLLLLAWGVLRLLFSRSRRRAAEPVRVILALGGEAGLFCARKLAADPGAAIVGSVGTSPIPGTARLGGHGQLGVILRREKPDLVILCSADAGTLAGDLKACDDAGVRPLLLPSGTEHLGSRPYVSSFAGVPLLDPRRVPLDDPAAETIKRLGDILGAAALLVLTAPVLLAAAAGTRLTSRGPVIFSQERIGRDNRPFRMYKFRSMAVGSEEQGGWTRAGDPRRTAFGALLRRSAVDELPQLINVLRGEMSLVGPRPEQPCHVERFRQSIPRYMVRHRVRPGLTGWAQVNGLRGDTSIPRRVEHDLWYIENWSPLLDGRILLLTPFRCLFNRQEPLKKLRSRADPR